MSDFCALGCAFKAFLIGQISIIAQYIALLAQKVEFISYFRSSFSFTANRKLEKRRIEINVLYCVISINSNPP